MLRGVILGALLLSGCTKSTSGTCGGASDCPAGSVCQEGACAQLCVVQDNCPTGMICSLEGVCASAATGDGPVVTEVLGNELGDPSRVRNGLVLRGARLTHAAFELRGTPLEGEGAVALTVANRTDTEVAVTLPADITSGSFALVVTNLAGSTQVDVTLTLPELGGQLLLDRINHEASGSIDKARLPIQSQSAEDTLANGDSIVLSVPQSIPVVTQGYVQRGDAWVAVESFPPRVSRTGNLALGLPLTGSTPLTDSARATDGNLRTDGGWYATHNATPGWFQLDLGAAHELTRIRAVFYHGDARAYRDVVIRIAETEAELDTAGGGVVVFNNDKDNSLAFGVGTDEDAYRGQYGHAAVFSPSSARFVRLHGNGSTSNTGSHLVELEIFAQSSDAQFRIERDGDEVRLINLSGSEQRVRLVVLGL